MDFTSFLIVCLSVLLFISFYLNIVLSYKMRKYINKEKIRNTQESEDLDRMFKAQINELTDDYIFKNSKNEKFDSVQDAINVMSRDVNGLEIRPVYDYGKGIANGVPIITGDKDTDSLLEDERIAQDGEPTTADKYNEEWLKQQTNQNNRLENKNGESDN